MSLPERLVIGLAVPAFFVLIALLQLKADW
jgi:hypothetical protein